MKRIAAGLVGIALLLATGCGGGAGGGTMMTGGAAPQFGTLVLTLPKIHSAPHPRQLITLDTSQFVITVGSMTPITVTGAQLAAQSNTVTIPGVPVGSQTLSVQTQTFFGTSATSLNETINVTPGTDALTIDATLVPTFSLADLKGTYACSLLETAPGVLLPHEGRVSGTLTFDGHGGVSAATLAEENDEIVQAAPTLTSGTYQVNSTTSGSFTVTLNLSSGTTTLTGHMNSSKDLLACTDVRQAGAIALHGTGAVTLIAGTFSNANLSTNLGSLMVSLTQNLGLLSAQTLALPSSVSGLSLTAQGAASSVGVLALPLDTTPQSMPDPSIGVTFMAAGQDFVFGTLHDPNLEPSVAAFVNLRATANTVADLQGTYGFESAVGSLLGNPTPYGTTLDGTMTFDGNGSITAVQITQTNPDGSTTPVQLVGTGTYAFVGNVLTANFQLNPGGSLTLTGFENPRDNVVIGSAKPSGLAPALNSVLLVQ